jgi:hypothetical protein
MMSITVNPDCCHEVKAVESSLSGNLILYCRHQKIEIDYKPIMRNYHNRMLLLQDFTLVTRG